MAKDSGVCPCGFAAPYADHCGRIHLGGAGLGTTAEGLMRARYSAYVLHDRSFLQVSWHPDTSPAAIDFDDNIEWLGLEIVHTESGAALDSIGVVEFRARFSRSSENLELHERSSFVRVDGLWVYVSGT
ncbi:MAG: YchJ family protein [Acidimicrobiales bacterium]|jgi:SEC-C motif-containing protein